MYRCENWTIKKVEHQRIDVFELWCWRRLFRVLWRARWSNQSILKEINPEYSIRTDVKAESPILWPPDMKSLLIRKDPDSGKDCGQAERRVTRGWGCWMASSTQSTWVWASFRRSWRTGEPGVLRSMGSQSAGYGWVTEQEEEEACVKLLKTKGNGYSYP